MPTWLEENPPQSPNVVVSWKKLLLNVPDCALKFEAADAVLQALKDKPKAFLEAFGKPLPKPKAKPESKTDSKAQANQGAGIFRDLSGSAGSRRAAVEKAVENIVDPRVMNAAKQILNHGQKDLEYRIAALQNTCGRDIKRDTAIQAITLAIAQAAQ
jgi:hypothetical protein